MIGGPRRIKCADRIFSGYIYRFCASPVGTRMVG
ncbi:hypothetical protein NK6_9770 [Bradyrhizobium diazoefficiens]|jgi:hypothetical protein|uniref:Uncharacterized protein n=1 Tax=Bradyrhizobium diazoefficiens TaxID=1355477 RepID=A0A0E3VXM2_9BRAD|nr:hypothetical protein NK6_9770 [Bradyrhizobium diazoefficiens]